MRISTLSLFGSSAVLGALAHFVSSEAALVCSASAASLGTLRLLNGAAKRLPSPLANAIRWTHSLAIEVFSILASLLLRPFRLLSSHRAPAGLPDGGPILLVHGYCHDSSAWVYHRRQLAKAGLGPLYTIDLGYPFHSIERYAEKVKEKAEQIAKETKRTDLVLIGHSMGGLVSSWYAVRLALPQTVTDVITIGSPLDGTCPAKIGLGPNAREMEPGSSFVKALQEEIGKCQSIRFFHIATKTDQLVIPSESALPKGPPERRFVVDDIGHVALLFSPRIANQLSLWLRGR
jgi:triacylglycerol esterase/lipase EstA (alpha/beta hydrolase family)